MDLTRKLVDKSLLKNLIARLNKHAFEAFVPIFFNLSRQERGERFEPFAEIGEGVFRVELLDSYGGSIHALYMVHYLPIEVFRRPKEILVADPTIVGKLRRIRDRYKGELGQWGMVSPYLVPGKALREIYFLNNFAGMRAGECRARILPRYKKILRRFKLNPHIYGVGCCDSFMERNPEKAEEALQIFFSQRREGLRICLEEERTSVETFQCQKSLFAGVSHVAKQPYEPVIVDNLRKKENCVVEFEGLIKKGAKESELEKFISTYYKDIFGSKYDRIETQLWLRCPEYDIAGKERRLDVFLRNSVINDWELFEIKRPVKVTSTYRDVPVIAHEVTQAIQQAKNYARILTQDAVKKQLAKEGIEYYEPSLNLVIGRTPQIPLAQWRWLLNTCGKDLKIFTFDELLKEMEMRLRDLYKIIEAKE